MIFCVIWLTQQNNVKEVRLHHYQDKYFVIHATSQKNIMYCRAGSGSGFLLDKDSSPTYLFIQFI
jgi:hypothetical protein